MNKINPTQQNRANFQGVKTPHKEVKTMEEAFKKFVKIIRDRAEREVPEYGDFAPVYEQFANPKKELSATDFMLKISKTPKSVENNEKIRNLEVVAYKLPAPYKAECIVATGTKEELMQKLQDSKLLKEINETAESLARDLDDI